jgi:hypothetical protein
VTKPRSASRWIIVALCSHLPRLHQREENYGDNGAQNLQSFPSILHDLLLFPELAAIATCPSQDLA